MRKADDRAKQATAVDADNQSERQVPQPDINRRKLLRGAAAVAPVVMTLRSGGVFAQASCSPANVIEFAKATSNEPGAAFKIAKSTNIPDSQLIDETCVQLSQTSCENANRLPKDGVYQGIVQSEDQQLYCTGNGTYPGNDETIAIVSAYSGASLTNW